MWVVEVMRNQQPEQKDQREAATWAGISGSVRIQGSPGMNAPKLGIGNKTLK